VLTVATISAVVVGFIFAGLSGISISFLIASVWLFISFFPLMAFAEYAYNKFDH